jgi:hypothetical protein
MTTSEDEGQEYDVFLSHSHRDAERVAEIAGRLEDEHGLRVWLDRWVLVPGKPWQREIEQGLESARSCAVCIGQKTPERWSRTEMERALDRQNQSDDFRVIPVLLPEAAPDVEQKLRETFVALNTWVDLRAGQDPDYAFHLLVAGVKGVPPGRWKPKSSAPEARDELVEALKKLRQLTAENLLDKKVAERSQQKIVEKMLISRLATP